MTSWETTMATEIQWTDETWNPVTGCSKVSPGCAHCYAEGVALRFWKTQYPIAVDRDGIGIQPFRPREFTDVYCHEDRLDAPLRWRKPKKVFVNSMSDLFHEDVPAAFIERVFDTMALTPRHTYQVLTKRANRMHGLVPTFAAKHTAPNGSGWPLSNVWLGVSVENQRFADERIPLLLQTPAAVRFLSCEPLIEGLDLAKHRPGANRLWVIVGGESGTGARPCDVRWIRSIVRQCQEADVPVFVKQLGANVRDRNDAGFEGDTPHSWPMDTAYTEEIHHGWQGDPVLLKLRDRKGGDLSEWPEDLRVREFPAVRT